MAQTQQKKENEKKRIQRRKAKEEKRELKRDNNDKGKSFEELFAYVDEFGNLSDTPPETKYQFKESDLIRPNTPVDEYYFGRVSHYNENARYGFIRDNETKESVYFNDTLVGFSLEYGQQVKFKMQRGRQGMQVSEVVAIKS